MIINWCFLPTKTCSDNSVYILGKDIFKIFECLPNDQEYIFACSVTKAEKSQFLPQSSKFAAYRAGHTHAETTKLCLSQYLWTCVH